MESVQYEELCRHFIAEQTGMTLDAVKSIHIPNPLRPGLPEYKHQIDLYWETGSDIALYLNIANAKWRSSSNIEQGEVLLLQQVRQQVAAHKAFMITNIGFTSGAIAAAKDHGIALHCVVPEFDVSNLPLNDRSAIQTALREEASATNRPIYSFHVEHRGLGFRGETGVSSSEMNPANTQNRTDYETRVIQPGNRAIIGPSTNRAFGISKSHGGTGNRGGGGIERR